MSHRHSHCHEEGDGDDHESIEMGIQYSLFQKIDMLNMECLNEELQGSGKLVFKPYERRLNFNEYVSSDLDEELLFNIPFVGNVKLKGIIIIGADDDSHPKAIRMFKNRPKMSFSDVSAKPDQEFHLQRDPSGCIEYPIKVVQFSSVHHLSLHFPSNFGDATTTIYYIGLRGEFSEPHHHGVTICNYEARPNITDHKTDIQTTVNRHVH